MKEDKHNQLKRTQRLVGGLVALAIAGAAYATTASNKRVLAPSDDLTGTTSCVHSADDLSTAFARVAESIRESVVTVKSVNRIEALPADTLSFRRFPFGDLFGQWTHPRIQPQLPEHGFAQQGHGTGFIVREDGYVLTNNHVVKDADEVTVTLWDESTYAASIVGTDPKTDLAVLRIEADELKAAPLGDDSTLRVGHWVAAVGNPFGLSSTMTAGIVSAVGRSRVGLADYEDFIQTDAAINPGNSGGPLVNLAGQVVGINTAIFSRNGGHMGIGFAIPINMAKTIVDSLIEDGHVERGFLGVMIQNLDRGLAESFGYDSREGALVSDVHEDSPAEAAGLQAGDIITRFDGKLIDDIDTLRLQVANTRPGSTVTVEYVRAGEALSQDIEIAELEPGAGLAPSTSNSRSLGMKLETLSPALAQRLDLDSTRKGVLVTSVEPFGVAALAGIRLNHVILAVNGTEVDGVEDFDRAVRAADLSKGARLTVLSGSSKRFVFLREDIR